MLTIRLQRTGAKNQASFRIVLAEAHRAASKKYLEVLGHYNPRSKDFGIKSEERLKHWLAQNVNLSPTVQNLLIEKKLVEGTKVKAWQPKKSASADPAAVAKATLAEEASSGGSAEAKSEGGREQARAPAETVEAVPKPEQDASAKTEAPASETKEESTPAAK